MRFNISTNLLLELKNNSLNSVYLHTKIEIIFKAHRSFYYVLEISYLERNKEAIMSILS